MSFPMPATKPNTPGRERPSVADAITRLNAQSARMAATGKIESRSALEESPDAYALRAAREAFYAEVR